MEIGATRREDAPGISALIRALTSKHIAPEFTCDAVQRLPDSFTAPMKVDWNARLMAGR